MKLRSILIIHLFCSMLTIHAQEDVCVNDVIKMYKLWTQQIENTKAGVYLKYNYTIEIKQQGQLNKNTAVMEVMSDDANAIFYTKDLRVFQDQKYTVTVMDDKKLIVVNGYVGDAYKQQKINQLQLLKDTIFQMVTTKECKQVSMGGKTYKKVLLLANAQANKLYKVKTMELLLDEKLNQVKKITVKYVEGHRFYAMKMEVLQQKLNYQLTGIKKQVLKNVFNSDGKLLSKYEGYQLIDNRN